MPINGQKFTLISFFFEVNQLYFHGVQEKLCFSKEIGKKQKNTLYLIPLLTSSRIFQYFFQTFFQILREDRERTRGEIWREIGEKERYRREKERERERDNMRKRENLSPLGGKEAYYRKE